MKKTATHLILFFWSILVTFAQIIPEKGVPPLENFTPDQYQNKGKVWDIKTAPNGIVYMAADNGLLEYDGKNWRSFKGSNGFTRSIFVVNDSLIYSGSDLDFGVWKKNKFQGFDYSSLYPFQETVQEISEEFWDVYHLGEAIVFVSSHNIYIFQNEQLVKTTAPSRFTGSFQNNGTLYLADQKSGLFVLEDYSLKQVFGYPENIHFEIAGIYDNVNGLVIVTKNHGLYQFVSGRLSGLKNELSDNLEIAKVFSFEQIGEEYLAFGTVLKGLYIADFEGNIIHRINRHKGLLSNTILALHYSLAGKLWLGMDYGISSIDLGNYFTWFYDYRGDFGTGYTALLKEGKFLLGTNQGLYHARWTDLNNNLDFFDLQIIPETEGQVWTLEYVDNTVFMGHDKGLFFVNKNSVEKLDGNEGVWSILQYNGFLLAGNYNGISIYQKKGNQWSYMRKMELILGSCNQLLLENDNILWVNIPNFGLIRAVLNDELVPIERIIFPQEDFDGSDAYLIKDDTGIHLLTNKFKYSFNAANKKFSLSGEARETPQLKGGLPGIFKSVQLNSEYEFYPVYNGFALKYLRSKESNKPSHYALTIRKVEAFRNRDEKLIFPGAKVPFPFNNFHVECIVPNQENVLYQYHLNENTDWNDWISENTFDFVGLPPGKHEIRVRAMVQGDITEEKLILLSIAPPWYRTWYAYLLYVLLILILIYVLWVRHNRALKKQKRKMLLKEQNALRKQSEKHRQELQQIAQERLQTEYDQLKQQLKNKTIELANKAHDIVEKNKLILTLKETCEKAQKNPSITSIKLAEMSRMLDSFLIVEDNTFEIQMDELHQDFFKKLKEEFPGLSSNDLRLCAYLKIGLNSKEIAEIMNIMPSSSYISRSRLRKKLNLQADEDLYSFLNRF